MSQDERRAGWLARVFGASAESDADGQLAESERIDPAAVIKELEAELQRTRSGCEELAERVTEAETALEGARRDREIARTHANTTATKIAGLLDARRAQEERLTRQTAELEAARGEIATARDELEAARGEIATARDELARARTDLTKERARAAAVQASTRQVASSYDAQTKRAQEQRAQLERERDAALRTLAEEGAVRDAERRVAASALVEAMDARRREERASRRLAALLRALVTRSSHALDLALGRGAVLALRASAGYEHAPVEPGEARMELSEALDTITAALRAADLLERALVADAASDPPRVTLELGPGTSSAALRALLAIEAEAWVHARSGRRITVSTLESAATAREARGA